MSSNYCCVKTELCATTTKCKEIHFFFFHIIPSCVTHYNSALAQLTIKSEASMHYVIQGDHRLRDASSQHLDSTEVRSSKVIKIVQRHVSTDAWKLSLSHLRKKYFMRVCKAQIKILFKSQTEYKISRRNTLAAFKFDSIMTNFGCQSPSRREALVRSIVRQKKNKKHGRVLLFCELKQERAVIRV